MEILRNKEEKIMCPYNNSHHIAKHKMEIHLMRCKESCKDSDKYAECDFNTCHRIPKGELQHHHENCPDRNIFELQLYQEEGTPQSASALTGPRLHHEQVNAIWNYRSLPHTTSFSASNNESVPDARVPNVEDLMDRLANKPKQAVVQKLYK